MQAEDGMDSPKCNVGKCRFDRLLSSTSTELPDDAEENDMEVCADTTVDEPRCAITPKKLHPTLDQLSKEQELLEQLEEGLLLPFDASQVLLEKLESSLQLQSELARWAVHVVHWEETWGALCDEPALPSPRLQSELGLWAQDAVHLEETWGAVYDGPALTAEGVALDLDTGSGIFFSHSRELASSYEWKERIKEEARLLAALKFASAARQMAAQVDTEEVCSIDPEGVIRGAESGKSKMSSCRPSFASQQKLFHQKRRRCRLRNCQPEDPNDLVLCADQTGKVTVYLTLPKPSSSRGCSLLLHRKNRAHTPVYGLGAAEVIIIDAHGTAHTDFDD